MAYDNRYQEKGNKYMSVPMWKRPIRKGEMFGVQNCRLGQSREPEPPDYHEEEFWPDPFWPKTKRKDPLPRNRSRREDAYSAYHEPKLPEYSEEEFLPEPSWSKMQKNDPSLRKPTRRIDAYSAYPEKKWPDPLRPREAQRIDPQLSNPYTYLNSRKAYPECILTSSNLVGTKPPRGMERSPKQDDWKEKFERIDKCFEELQKLIASQHKPVAPSNPINDDPCDDFDRRLAIIEKPVDQYVYGSNITDDPLSCHIPDPSPANSYQGKFPSDSIRAYGLTCVESQYSEPTASDCPDSTHSSVHDNHHTDSDNPRQYTTIRPSIYDSQQTNHDSIRPSVRNSQRTDDSRQSVHDSSHMDQDRTRQSTIHSPYVPSANDNTDDSGLEPPVPYGPNTDTSGPDQSV